jgi:tRNA-Thr(GGU) m(6)t(6)A37 methyltransferase TsaA
MIAYTPIGLVRNGVRETSLERWAHVQSEIHLHPQYARGLQGLEAFSHVVVVFHLHESAAFDLDRELLRHPRRMEHLPAVGVFAQRTKQRPNPIGITAVELRGVSNNVVTVNALDALDGTPVLDLKPYVPVFDRVENARVPAWVEEFVKGYF